MIIALVFAACLDANECRTFNLLCDPYSCMIAGRPEVARWQASHANRRVERWFCDLLDPRVSEL